ncbi:16S rRNA (cytosine(1402)-N(4))-methyltransferase RsmH [Corticibacter populi]|uniref:Ribosomal RNA small subunit methyltransferase H n=1 Tax=Corticibacter populi TaxID=1550736 RepID=A0A3M6QNI5_9BURK|nr:16S rRNA (cytosine(1402)-N(4))-methyltransferase RsmH [Corticibacter populi]RMX04311.1 16S rRNA (cytosine(1402)-N(4))-methyltransferase RsmH [Corticibacter populi]RZS33066.1 16S rRNA (cytosine1402-N4)-methyltransferase [Corticibacter populi]
MQHPFQHTTVLLHEAVEALMAADTTAPRCWVDGTFGRGGHSRLILSRMDAQDTLVVFDKDPEAVAQAHAIGDARLQVRHEGFANLSALPAASVDGLLMDLGVSSPQIDDAGRGFSFRFDGPLDMRMDSSRGQTVAQWLEGAELGEIAEVIREYGEERYAGSIAKAIVARRQERGPLTRTTELAELVAGAVRSREAGQNPATRTFQALRIFINAELEELQQALAAALAVLKPGARLVVISFHSLEDRIVKRFIEQHSRQHYDRRMPLAAEQPMRLRAVARIKPSAAEVAANPRARSAIMRVAERTEVAC